MEGAGEAESGEKLLRFRTDNGGEFKSNSLMVWLKLEEVKRNFTRGRG